MPVFAHGSVAVGSVLWRAQGELNVTAIVKATLSIVPEETMVCAAPEPIAVAERYERGSPFGRLEAIRETAPRLPLVDVVVYGHAYAPVQPDGQRRGIESTARLALVRDGKRVVDKTIAVRGDTHRGGLPQPFERIPLSFESSLGGIGFDSNPLGVGIDSDSSRLPSLIDPDDPYGRPACMWPIPQTYPARRQLRGSLSANGLHERIVEIPDDLEWSCFQAAPLDQRLELLRGDEWVLLKGLSESATVMRSRLPGITAMMRAYRGGRSASDPVQLRADVLQIRPDAMQCTILWRASMPLADEQAASDLAIIGALQMPDQDVSWPATTAELPPVTAPSAPPPLGDLDATVALTDDATAQPPTNGWPLAGASELEGTHVLTAEQSAKAAAGAQAPFPLHHPSSPPEEGAEAAAIPGAPWARKESASSRAPSATASSHEPTAPDSEADEHARLAAARAEAQRLAAKEAEKRRQAEAERFEAEQQAARVAVETRAAEQLQRRRTQANKIKTNMYAAFTKRKS